MSQAIPLVATTIVLAKVLRRWAWKKIAIRERLEHFTVDGCSCCFEGDRPLICQSIALLMKATGEVEAYATDEDALEAFNDIARCSLSSALIASIGHAGLRYRHTCVLFLFTVLPAYLDHRLSSDEPAGMPLYRECAVMRGCCEVFGIYPLAFIFMSRWCGACTDLRGFREQLF